MPTPNNLAQTFKRVSRAKPQPTLDTTENTPDRGGMYQEGYSHIIMPGNKMAADEGSYFAATNPTPGTGVAHALVTAFTATAALFAIQNKAPAGSKLRVYLDFLRLILTAAPTATTAMQFVVQTDSTSRQPTANNVPIVPVNVNNDDATGSISNVQAFSAGSLTVPAATGTARTVDRFSIPTSLGIVGDEYLVQFGATDHAGAQSGLTAVRATAPAKLVTTANPVIIGAQQWAVIFMWWLTEATTAPSFEYSLGLIER